MKIRRWEDEARALFADVSFLHEMFVERTDFLAKCSREELKVIREHWGDELFCGVMGADFSAVGSQELVAVCA